MGSSDLPEEPLISVVIPTYEDSELIDRAIDSVKRQTYNNVEIIIVDSSGVPELESLAKADSEIKYLFEPPSNPATARNRGIAEANGEVIGFCDADDYWLEEKLSHQIPKLKEEADIVYSDEYLLKDGSRSLRPSLPIQSPDDHHIDYFRKLGVGSRSVLCRRECLIEESFDESFDLREDPHLWTRLFARFSPARVAEPLSVKCHREESITGDADAAYQAQCKEISDLLHRFPELRPYETERRAHLEYRYASKLLRQNRRIAARQASRRGLETGHMRFRLFLTLAASYLPIANNTVVQAIKRAFWSIQKYL